MGGALLIRKFARGSGPLMTFHWRFVPPERVPADPPVPSSFTSQSDAESWLGESWRALADADVRVATLVEGQTSLYDMSLAPE